MECLIWLDSVRFHCCLITLKQKHQTYGTEAVHMYRAVEGRIGIINEAEAPEYIVKVCDEMYDNWSVFAHFCQCIHDVCIFFNHVPL